MKYTFEPYETTVDENFRLPDELSDLIGDGTVFIINITDKIIFADIEYYRNLMKECEKFDDDTRIKMLRYYYFRTADIYLPDVYLSLSEDFKLKEGQTVTIRHGKIAVYIDKSEIEFTAPR